MSLSNEFLRQQIEVPCPSCKTSNKATVQQVQQRAQIRCRGCGATINLSESGDATRKVKQTLDQLERELRKLR